MQATPETQPLLNGQQRKVTTPKLSAGPARTSPPPTTPLRTSPTATSPSMSAVATPQSASKTPVVSTTPKSTGTIPPGIQEMEHSFVGILNMLHTDLVHLEQEKVKICCPGLFGKKQLQRLTDKQLQINCILNKLIPLVDLDTRENTGAACLRECINKKLNIQENIFRRHDANHPAGFFASKGFLEFLLAYKNRELLVGKEQQYIVDKIEGLRMSHIGVLYHINEALMRDLKECDDQAQERKFKRSSSSVPSAPVSFGPLSPPGKKGVYPI